MIKNVVQASVILFLLGGSICLGAEGRVAVRQDDPKTIHGAVYVPAEAYNAPQMWKNFSAAETRRDFHYAQQIHLNALRVWASYEYWQMAPDKFKNELDEMLEIAHHDGIRILLSLFENDGSPPTPQNMWTTDPTKAFAIQSPGPDITNPAHKDQWSKPRKFVTWFMKHYRNDDRLLAIEVMNEPFKRSMPFAKDMLLTAKALQGSVPLTMGTASVESAKQYIPLGLDIIEFHGNFPRSSAELARQIESALAVGRKHHLPVWLTEWQRARPHGSGWGNQAIKKNEIPQDYASLAATIQKYPIGNFFWSLMVKPAYLRSQRQKGTINGLFWPNGSVWSLKDARAIARDPELNLKEDKTIPKGFLTRSKAKNNLRHKPSHFQWPGS